MKNAEVIKIGLSATRHGYDAEYRMFLDYMYEDPTYSIGDFFRYAAIAADDENWLYDGNEEMFKGTRLEADKGVQL